MPREAICNFSMPICGISCYGELWNIPCQDKTYEYRTQLRPSIFNEMSLEYLALIDKEARRNLDDVANEMNLINIGCIRYKRAIARLGSNVFCPDNKYPVFPFFSPERDISFLRLIFDIKCHLIHNALMKLNRHRRYRHYLRYGEVVRRNTSPHTVHNMIIEKYVTKYIKYIDNGVVIDGLCSDFHHYRSSGVVHVVDDVSKMSRGMNATIASNYYYPEYYTDGEYEDSADSDSDNYDDNDDESDVDE